MQHSAILSSCTMLLPIFKTFVLSIFKKPLKTGFTVYKYYLILDIDFVGCLFPLVSQQENYNFIWMLLCDHTLQLKSLSF